MPFMAFAFIKEQLRLLGDEELLKDAEDIHNQLTQRHGIPDIPLPQTDSKEALADLLESPETSPAEIEIFSLNDTLRKAWEENDLTPELIDNFYSFFWKERQEIAMNNKDGSNASRLSVSANQPRKIAIEKLSEPLIIPPCDRTVGELAELRRQNRAVILMPEVLMQPDGEALIGELFPDALISAHKRITNKDHRGGCIDVEMDIQTPPQRAWQVYSHNELIGQRFQTYVVASHINQILTGHHFDERSHSALLGSYLPKDKNIEITNRSTRKPFAVYPGILIRDGHRSEGFKKE